MYQIHLPWGKAMHIRLNVKAKLYLIRRSQQEAIWLIKKKLSFDI